MVVLICWPSAFHDFSLSRCRHRWDGVAGSKTSYVVDLPWVLPVYNHANDCNDCTLGHCQTFSQMSNWNSLYWCQSYSDFDWKIAQSLSVVVAKSKTIPSRGHSIRLCQTRPSERNLTWLVDVLAAASWHVSSCRWQNGECCLIIYWL
jgi:hypothetical protein